MCFCVLTSNPSTHRLHSSCLRGSVFELVEFFFSFRLGRTVRCYLTQTTNSYALIPLKCSCYHLHRKRCNNDGFTRPDTNFIWFKIFYSCSSHCFALFLVKWRCHHCHYFIIIIIFLSIVIFHCLLFFLSLLNHTVASACLHLCQYDGC